MKTVTLEEVIGAKAAPESSFNQFLGSLNTHAITFLPTMSSEDKNRYSLIDLGYELKRTLGEVIRATKEASLKNPFDNRRKKKSLEVVHFGDLFRRMAFVTYGIIGGHEQKDEQQADTTLRKEARQGVAIANVSIAHSLFIDHQYVAGYEFLRPTLGFLGFKDYVETIDPMQVCDVGVAKYTTEFDRLTKISTRDIFSWNEKVKKKIKQERGFVNLGYNGEKDSIRYTFNDAHIEENYKAICPLITSVNEEILAPLSEKLGTSPKERQLKRVASLLATHFGRHRFSFEQLGDYHLLMQADEQAFDISTSKGLEITCANENMGKVESILHNDAYCFYFPRFNWRVESKK